MDRDILSRYNSQAGATDYCGKFGRRWTERVNNWHEQRLLRRLIRVASIEKLHGPVLDLPCGYGRLFPVLSQHGSSIIESDWSFPLLTAARALRTHNGNPPAAGYVRATALNLPFSDGAFDLVLSVRLCHHIREHEERIDYLREIMRVSGKWLVFTYFDGMSFKNRFHEFRRRFNGKRSKWILYAREIDDVSRAQGFQVVRSIWVSRFFSGHRYVLLRRTGATPPRQSQ